MTSLVMRNEERYRVPETGATASDYRGRILPFPRINTTSVANAPQQRETSALPIQEKYLESRQAGEVPGLNFTAPERTTTDEQEYKIASRKPLTIDDLGWTREQAAIIRGLFGAIADDWDDPSMDVYDDL